MLEKNVEDQKVPKKTENMDAENVEKLMNGLNDFGGIYSLNQLRHIKILSFPVSFVVLTYGHWISIYITNDTVEIMDSAGYLNSENMHKSLKKFLRVHINHKKFTVTPKLQSDESSSCALYACVFIYYRTLTGKSLCDFCEIFTSDTSLNCTIIKELYSEIWKNQLTN